MYLLAIYVRYFNAILLYAGAAGTTLTAVNTKQLFMRTHRTQQCLASFTLIIRRNCCARSLFTELCLYTRVQDRSARTSQAKRRSATLLMLLEDICNGKKPLKFFRGKIETEHRSKFENLFGESHFTLVI